MEMRYAVHTLKTMMYFLSSFILLEKNYIPTLLVACEKNQKLLGFQLHVFERMLEEDHDMMYAFMLYISKRGMKNQALLNCLYYQTLTQRVAFWLVSMNNLDK